MGELVLLHQLICDLNPLVPKGLGRSHPPSTITIPFPPSLEASMLMSVEVWGNVLRSEELDSSKSFREVYGALSL